MGPDTNFSRPANKKNLKKNGDYFYAKFKQTNSNKKQRQIILEHVPYYTATDINNNIYTYTYIHTYIHMNMSEYLTKKKKRKQKMSKK